MTLKTIFIIFFLVLIVYSTLRPFYSISQKLFLLVGSCLGLLSVAEISYVNSVADFFGIQGGGKDLYLYISFLTIFLFIFYSAQKFKNLEDKIVKLTRQIALDNVKRK